ncbi:unnamed protein product [Paramecium sonneborni]|uniref:Uncharacterized protein n=1 Tax=Paramecium sonneborni TaxID=65129 RepID=A0A8S1MDF2_9CILI|nr:unnamed protein product [Paramecium sonneborni]
MYLSGMLSQGIQIRIIIFQIQLMSLIFSQLIQIHKLSRLFGPEFLQNLTLQNFRYYKPQKLSILPKKCQIQIKVSVCQIKLPYYIGIIKMQKNAQYSAELCAYVGNIQQCLMVIILLKHNQVEQFYRADNYKRKFCSYYPNNICEFDYRKFCSFAYIF